MTHNTLIEDTIAFVKQKLEGAEGGHDWFHCERVYNTSMILAKEEHEDPLVIALAALLHDIADAKFFDGDETIGPEMARNFLEEKKVHPEVTAHVVKIIEHMSFKNSLDPAPERAQFNSKALQIVQDADRLDAIGAIGIARAFNYGGFKNRAIYDPNIPPNLKMTKEAYKKSKAPTINHFYEKLLLLKEGMHTATGKKLAAQRHQFMMDFLDQFYLEWGPNAN